MNSIHLDGQPRRQEFRQARQRLVSARGRNTLAAEGCRGENLGSNTLIPCSDAGQPVHFRHVLMDKEFVYPLKVGINTIGRMPDNDLVLEDGGISRRHCAVLVHACDRAEVHDTASKNGTYVNGRRLTGPAPLVPGDEIRICNRLFIFMTQPNEPEASSPPAPTVTLAE